MARCVERSDAFSAGKSQPTLPKIRVDTRFSEDSGVEELFPILSVPPIGFGQSTKTIGVREKVWKKKEGGPPSQKLRRTWQRRRNRPRYASRSLARREGGSRGRRPTADRLPAGAARPLRAQELTLLAPCVG